MGYHLAGFDVVGVDKEPIKDYPFTFVQCDALEYLAEHGTEFCAIHASPPCQAYSEMQKIWDNSEEHPDLVAPTRKLLQETGKPFVIENVVGAPLRVDLMLCGTMFGLGIIRHRIFESNVEMPLLVPCCNHSKVYDPWHGEGRTSNKFRQAMGIDWMKDAGGGRRKGTLAQAIPPAYTEFIGRILLPLVSVQPPLAAELPSCGR
jgi:hypothetical protein